MVRANRGESLIFMHGGKGRTHKIIFLLREWVRVGRGFQKTCA